jgi:hypothetical protein
MLYYYRNPLKEKRKYINEINHGKLSNGKTIGTLCVTTNKTTLTGRSPTATRVSTPK